MLGPGTEFRDGQWEALIARNRRERVLVVSARAGAEHRLFSGGKDLADAGPALALLISRSCH